jgi:hypothetical protein
VTTKGRLSRLTARAAAQPDIQKCACTMSGQLELEHLGEVVAEGGHMRPQIVFGHRGSRSGGHVDHLIARRCGYPLPQVRVIKPGIDRN